MPESARAPVDLTVFTDETRLLAETDPETLLKGLLLECRELLRGTAEAICTNAHYSERLDYQSQFRDAVNLGVRVADAITKLRGGASEERLQRIIVERIDGTRKPSAKAGPAGEGDVPPENE